MFIYFVNMLTLLLLSVKELFVNKFKKSSLMLILFSFLVVFSLIAGVRYGVGQDFFSYYNIFSTVKNYTDLSGWIEPGFRAVIVASKSIGIEVQGLYFVFGLITYSFLLIGLKKINHYPIFSFYLFFMLFNIGYVYNVMRQGIAMAIFIFLLKDIIDKRFLKVFIFSLIAASFHSVGYLILFAYFIKNFEVKKNFYISMTIICCALYFLSSSLSTLIINVLPDSLYIIMNSYIDSFSFSVDNIGFLQRLIIIAVFVFYYNNLKSNSIEMFSVVFLFYFVGFFLYNLFSFQGMFATRINMFFRILEIVLYPCLLDVKVPKLEKYLLLLFILLITSLNFIVELQSPVNYPFTTYF